MDHVQIVLTTKEDKEMEKLVHPINVILSNNYCRLEHAKHVPFIRMFQQMESNVYQMNVTQERDLVKMESV